MTEKRRHVDPSMPETTNHQLTIGKAAPPPSPCPLLPAPACAWPSVRVRPGASSVQCKGRCQPRPPPVASEPGPALRGANSPASAKRALADHTLAVLLFPSLPPCCDLCRTVLQKEANLSRIYGGKLGSLCRTPLGIVCHACNQACAPSSKMPAERVEQALGCGGCLTVHAVLWQPHPWRVPSPTAPRWFILLRS